MKHLSNEMSVRVSGNLFNLLIIPIITYNSEVAYDMPHIIKPKIDKYGENVSMLYIGKTFYKSILDVDKMCIKCCISIRNIKKITYIIKC